MGASSVATAVLFYSSWVLKKQLILLPDSFCLNPNLAIYTPVDSILILLEMSVFSVIY